MTEIFSSCLLVCVPPAVDGNSARRDFLTYALSLMRSHNDEHSDGLPVLDINALKHVAYVLDALIYYMRSGTDTDTDMIRDGVSVHSWQDHDENLNDEDTDDPVNQSIAMETESADGDSEVGGKPGRKHAFFQRSDSTTFLGCPPLDPFQTPLVKALPLADQPHLLQPNSRKEDLFGMPKPTIAAADREGTSSEPNPASPFDRLPTHLALSRRTVDSHPISAVAGTTAAVAPSCSQTLPKLPIVDPAPNVEASTSASVIVSPAPLDTPPGDFIDVSPPLPLASLPLPA